MKNSPKQIQHSTITTELIPKNLSIEKCLSEPPILRIAAHEGGTGRIAKLIYPQMDLMIRSLGCKMDDDLIVRLCIDFVEKFSYETIPDLLMVIEAGRKNMHPEIKIYGTVNMAILSALMKHQLEEKYTIKDNQFNKEQERLNGNSKAVFKSRKEYLKWAEEGLKIQDENEEKIGKKRKQKHSNALDRLVEISVSIGKGGKK